MSHPVAEERPVEHGDALNVVRTIVAEAPGPEAAAQRVVEALHDRFGHYDWVGIYWLDVDANELVLGPWMGPEATEHTRIPVGVGICGAAAASGQTEIVDDVDADPRYLACFAPPDPRSWSRSSPMATSSARSTSTGPISPPTMRRTRASWKRSLPCWPRSGPARKAEPTRNRRRKGSDGRP